MTKRFAFTVLLITLLGTSLNGVAGMSNANSAQAIETVYQPGEVDRKAKIKLKPEPPYTEEARKHEIRGKVVLRMILRASSEVTDIEVVKGLPYGLTEECIKVARRIKFQPAIKNDHEVSQYFNAEYNFILYG